MDDSGKETDPTKLVQEAIDRLETKLHGEMAAAKELVETEVAALDRLTTERFATVKDNLAAVEAHREEQKRDSETALKAAFDSVKDENRKTETATTKQIDNLTTTHKTALDNITRELNALTTRMTTLEGSSSGQDRARANLYAGLSALVALIVIGGFVFAFASRG